MWYAIQIGIVLAVVMFFQSMPGADSSKPSQFSADLVGIALAIIVTKSWAWCAEKIRGQRANNPE